MNKNISLSIVYTQTWLVLDQLKPSEVTKMVGSGPDRLGQVWICEGPIIPDPTYNNSEFEYWIDFESIYDFIIQFQSRCLSDPTLSDIDFKKWNGLGLNYP